MQELGSRRPIAARDFALSAAVARLLARAGASADGISLAGLVVSLLAATLLAAAPQHVAWPWFAAAVLIEVRLLCNMFDGMVAIERGTASRRGEIFNDVPDRIADAAVLIGLGYAPGGAPWLGYVAALLAVFTAYVRILGVSLGATADFSGPMAKPHRMQATVIVATICGIAAAWGWNHADIAYAVGVAALGLAVIACGTALTAVRRLTHLMTRLG